MQNSNLRCNAKNCAYNQYSECRAGAIKVGGSQAVSTEDTFCSSFMDKSLAGFTNSLDNGYTAPENIKCEARNCKYNESKACKAQDVKINENDASCETFIQ